MDKEYIENLIKADIELLGCSIWGIELVGSSNTPTLKIFIDKENGITIEDCEKVSRHVSIVFGVNNPSLNNLSLEVSSPGLERKFFNKDQYSSYIGCPIKIRYKNEENKYLSTKGILEKVNGEGLILKSTNKDFFIDFNSIDKANLEYTRVKNAK